MEEKKKQPYREVDTLPEVAVLHEVVLNKADKLFYIGIEESKEEEK